jgi:hypothetical protein
MATNYTTKTAALKATLADIRQVAVGKKIEVGSGETNTQITEDKVSAEDLLISVEGKDKRQSVKTLIQEAQEAATAAAGILIGDADKLVDVGDNKEDGIVSGGIGKMQNLNFRGKVMVVSKGDGTVDLWFGDNNNPPTPDKVTMNDVSGSEKYVYTSSAETPVWDTNGLTAGSKYGTTDVTTATETIDVNGGGVITLTEKTDVIVDITKADGTTVTAKSTINEDGSVTSVSTVSGVTITVKDLNGTAGKFYVNNDSTDANAGYTPGFMRGTVQVKLAHASIVPNGGTYTAKVTVGALSKTMTKMYIYKASNLTSANKPTVTASYAPGTSKHISGVQYDQGGTITVDVTNITGTQRAAAGANRLSIADNSGMTGNFSLSTVAITTKKTDGTPALVLTSDESTRYTDAAVFECTGSTASVSSSSPTKLSTTITVTPYEQSGSATSVAAAKGTATASSTGYVMSTYTENTNGTGTSCEYKFYSESDRKYNTLSDITTKAPISTYDSTKSLVGDYANQLLVQNGKLKYPTKNSYNDVISYSGAKGKRYYVAPLNFKYSEVKQINALSVKVASGISKTNGFMNDKIRLYICEVGNSTVQVLNAYKSAACSYGTAIANASAPDANGAWTCEVNPKGVGFTMFTKNGVTDSYYLVVEMEETATTDNHVLGQITVTATI